MSFKEIIKENLDKAKITKLSVFDFDGTLVDTPLPEIGKPIWKEKTGTDWPHVGWWGRKESLDINVFEHPVLPSVISSFNGEKANVNILTMMLTGRRAKLENEVKAILDKHGLKFDIYQLNDGGETSSNKIKHMGRILMAYPNIRMVELWDDRDEHIPKFQAWGDSMVAEGRLDEFKVNHVLGEHHGLTP